MQPETVCVFAINTGFELHVSNCLPEVSTTAGNRPTILAVELNQEE